MFLLTQIQETTQHALPEIDLTISISVILALAAIVSPIITAFINNAHHTKIRKMELKQQRFENTVIYQRNIFENYLKSAGRCISHSDREAKKDYGEFYFIALMYASPDLQSAMISANKYMEEADWTKASEAIESLVPMIHAIQQIK